MEKLNIDLSSITAYSGIVRLSRRDLEKLKAAKQKARIQMAGLLIIAKDVSPELAKETLSNVVVHGCIRASSEIKELLRRM